MSQPEFKDILARAKDRLASGEPLGSIVADYPDYADELRVLLRDDQHRVRDLLREEKAKPRVQPPARRVPLSVPLISLFVLVAAALLGYFVVHETAIVDPLQQPRYAAGACASLDYVPRPIAEQGQGSNQYEDDMALEEADSASAPAASGATMSALATSAPEDSGIDRATVEATATAIARDYAADSDDAAEMDAVGGIADEEAEALPDTGGGGGTMGASAPEPEAELAVEYPEGEEIVPTSVASFDERPADAAAESRSADVLDEPAPANPIQPLQAGEIDDNADWDTYQEYRRNYLQQYGERFVRDVDTTDRQVIRVVDAEALPVLGACVQVFHGERLITESFTYATGLTMFFPNLREDTRYVDEFTVRATYGQTVAESTLDRTAIGGALTVELPLERQAAQPRLDVMFLIDSTGSMADEIAQLQDNILAISTQIDALPGDVDVRYGLVTYRDRTDSYVTRVFDFTDDVRQFQADLNTVVAGGGGDYPESLNQGLDESLNVVSWRGADTIKLVFLVADAPPQLRYEDDVEYSESMQVALGRGIKIHPIASSGLQPEGEYILRQIGQYTMGHFIFLTYEGGVPGTPGEERPDLDVGEPEDPQGIGDYSVAELDELVLRLITDELESLRGE